MVGGCMIAKLYKNDLTQYLKFDVLAKGLFWLLFKKLF